MSNPFESEIGFNSSWSDEQVRYANKAIKNWETVTRALVEISMLDRDFSADEAVEIAIHAVEEAGVIGAAKGK